MKYFYILYFLFSYSVCSAQDPELFENTWYLHKLNIENIDYLPPDRGFPNSHGFTESPFSFWSSYCDAIDVAVTYNQNHELTLEDYPIILLGFCVDQEDLLFNSRYFSILYQDFGQAKNPFLYSITTNGTVKSLEISNADGDIAFYGSEPLSIAEFDSALFTIYPNPVKDKLLLSSKRAMGNLKINTFNIEGKLLSTQNVMLEKQVSVAISNLSKGIYFLNIEDEKGNTSIKKFIKL